MSYMTAVPHPWTLAMSYMTAVPHPWTLVMSYMTAVPHPWTLVISYTTAILHPWTLVMRYMTAVPHPWSMKLHDCSNTSLNLKSHWGTNFMHSKWHISEINKGKGQWSACKTIQMIHGKNSWNIWTPTDNLQSPCALISFLKHNCTLLQKHS
jgi:hypothetical protein